MLIISKDITKVKILKKKLIKIFDIKNLGLAKYFVGVQITKDRKKGTITLCQDAYINKVFKRYNIENCYLVNTPIALGATEIIILFKEQATNENIELYRSKIGSLIYLTVQTRPDILYKVSVLSRFFSNLLPQHMKAAD
jgi:hypothetical protein